ncbi:MAG: type IA DNA topoisomerase [Thermoprotei archaeon]|nr:MAG: type IA DNA topoisomerase [Thermoprotei archaeon]
MKLPFIDTVVVAEKNSVARNIALFLAESIIKTIKIRDVPLYFFRKNSKLWVSIGLRGHLMDYDFSEEYRRWTSTHPRNLFFITPVRIIREESKIFVYILRELAKRTNRVILALDADPEGESICFEVMEIMKKVNPRIKFERIWFSAVTKQDILNALKNPRQPDPLLAQKCFSRMMLDLIIGASFTRFITLAIRRRATKLLPAKRFLSYGPCQSPVLFLVVQRALEREKFVKKKYHTIEAIFSINGKRVKFKYYKEKIENRDEAKKILDEILKQGYGIVSKAEYVKRTVSPPIPLNTVEMERRASRFLNIRARQCMDLAEALYRNGLISYPRTDTTIYPPSLNLKRLASMFSNHELYGSYVRRRILSRPSIVPTRGRDDDKAHPPIYPAKSVGLQFVKKKFGEKGAKLYDFIVRHFLATLSPPAQIERQEIVIAVGKHMFTVNGLKILDLGFYEIYPYEKPSEKILPYVSRGTKVRLISAKIVEKETKPPPYLSESELLRLMRKYGIGTDATMQDHLQTNIERGYFYIRNKQCIPTPLGKTIAVALHSIVPELVSPEVRGSIEKELSLIASGIKRSEEVVESVKKRFLEYFDRLIAAEEKFAREVAESLKNMRDYWGDLTKRKRR